MCRLVGFANVDAAAMRSVLLDAGNSLRAQSKANPHGVGTATLGDGGLHIDKAPFAASESGVFSRAVNGAEDARDGATMLGHIRWRTVGPTNFHNTHPYANASNTMAAAHNGQISNLDALERELGPEEFKRIIATNDSGLWTSLAMREIDEHGVEEGIGRAVRWMDRNAPDSISGNFLVLQQDGTLAGVRTHDTNTLGISPTGAQAARQGAHDLGERNGWYVSSEAADPSHPWTGLRTGEAFRIDPDNQLHTWDVERG